MSHEEWTLVFSGIAALYAIFQAIWMITESKRDKERELRVRKLELEIESLRPKSRREKINEEYGIF